MPGSTGSQGGAAAFVRSSKTGVFAAGTCGANASSPSAELLGAGGANDGPGAAEDGAAAGGPPSEPPGKIEFGGNVCEPSEYGSTVVDCGANAKTRGSIPSGNRSRAEPCAAADGAGRAGAGSTTGRDGVANRGGTDIAGAGGIGGPTICDGAMVGVAAAFSNAAP